MMFRARLAHVLLAALVLPGSPLLAQVHYHPDGQPWKQRAERGPDAEVGGWYYNLGLTGLRVELVEDRPKALLVRHVFEGSPAHRKVQVGDLLTGAGGEAFREAHQNGYGMDVFGARGPIGELALALEASQTAEGRGRLVLALERDGKEREVTLRVGRDFGAYAAGFPADCPKSARLREELLELLVDAQRPDGSWGSPVEDTFAPLALLSSSKRSHRAAAKKNARYHAETTSAEDEGSLINWRYMAAGIVLAEYHLATGERWVLEELEEVRDFLLWSQYTDLAQVNPRVRESHPDAWPEGSMEQHGGWGHNPGFEGYGPICMLTGQGALVLALMERCGVGVDRARHDAAYAFLERGTGRNGYVWYEDEVAGEEDWADLGRTGASGVANLLSPYDDVGYGQRALRHAKLIGAHPQSFPDTHGSPLMGMGYAALAAYAHAPSFRALMDANRWWFALAQRHDGGFTYQPNRDNAGYGADARLKASAVVAFLLSIPLEELELTRAAAAARR